MPLATGRFTIVDLAPGDYTLQAEPCSPQHITISPGAITEAEINLTGCPSGRSPPLPPPSPPLPTLDPAELSELDSAAHNATLAAAPVDEATADEPATPEATRETSDLGRAGPSVNGLSPTANSTLLDGLSTTQNFHSMPTRFRRKPTHPQPPSAESATRSFSLQPRSFSAQNGSAGGLIAVTSRGQAARLHGTAFALTRQSIFAATNPFSVVTHYNNGAITSQLLKPDDSLVQGGAAAGFPLSRVPYLWLQHASLFLSLEGQIRSSQVVSTPAIASFYSLTAEQLALLANRGVTASAAKSALNFLDSLTGAQARDASRLLNFAHDWTLVPAVKQQVTRSATSAIVSTHPPVRAPEHPPPSSLAAAPPASRPAFCMSTPSPAAGSTVSPLLTTANELRGQFARDLEYRNPAHAAPAGNPRSASAASPLKVSIAPNGFSCGTPSSIGRIAYPDEHRLQLADTFTRAHGRHLFSFGADWSRITDRIAAATNAEGTFLYDSGITNGRDGGLVDWITDYTFNVHAYPNGACPSINAANHLFCFRSYTQGFSAASTQFATHELAFFAEDALRLPHALSLTFGARYDYTHPAAAARTPTLRSTRFSTPSVPPSPATTSVGPEDRNRQPPGPRVLARLVART